MNNSLFIFLRLLAGIYPVISCSTVAKGQPGGQEAARKEIFVRASISKSTCFVGESLLLSYSLFTAVSSSSKLVLPSNPKGFSYKILNDVADLNPSTELIDGRPFKVYQLSQLLVTPLFAGKLTIDGIRVQHEINADEQSQTNTTDINDLIRDLDKSPGKKQKAKIFSTYSNSITVNANALPEKNDDPDFKSTVGIFTVTGNIVTKKNTTNRVSRLRITISGTGNLLMSSPPSLQLPDGLMLAGTKLVDKMDAISVPLKTYRTYEYAITASSAGSYRIPPVAFEFFDPMKGDYRTAFSRPLELAIKDDDTLIPHQAPGANKSPAPGPLITASRSDKFVSKQKITPLAWLLTGTGSWIVCILLMMVIFHLVSKRRSKTSFKPVQQVTTDHYKILEDMIAANDFSNFYSTLYSLVWKICGDAYHILPTDQRKTNLVNVLARAGWQQPDIRELEKILDHCAWSLYVPGVDEKADYQQIYHHARSLLQQCPGTKD